MSVASKFTHDENHLMLLAVIAKMDKERVDADIEKLAELGKFFKSQVEYMLQNLLDDGLIIIDNEKKIRLARNASEKREGNNGDLPRPDNEAPYGSGGAGLSAMETVTVKLPSQEAQIRVHHLAITQKGLALLEEKKKELAKLSVAMQRLYNTKNRDELYRAIFWNKDWIALMLYTGVLSTNYLKTMMKFLGLDLYRLSMSESKETLLDLGIDIDLLSMGLFIVHPLLAIASYIISHVVTRKLEEKATTMKTNNPIEKLGRPKEDIYMPKIEVEKQENKT